MGLGGGGKGGSAKQAVKDYYMSIHYSVCLGVVDVLRRVWIGEKLWKQFDDSSSTGYTFHDHDDMGFFGGIKEGGGVSGRLHVLFGSEAQVLPDALKNRLHGDPAQVPGFRGFLSLFFAGRDGVPNATRNGYPGFVWGSNYPQIPKVEVEVTRYPKTEALSVSAAIGLDANPAHIILECLTSYEFGLGLPLTTIDLPSFSRAAQTLAYEAFGLSMQWTRQTTVEAFVNEILEHISATMAEDPLTGRIYLTLLRQDPAAIGMPVLTPSNARLSQFQRVAWGDTVNEISVTWTNPESEKEETVTVHDNASFSAQGQVVTDSRNYYGVRNRELAVRLGERDIRASATSLISCEAEVDRTFWGVKPGDILNLFWEEKNILNMSMRVGQVAYGTRDNGKIKISLLQNIFDMPNTVYDAGDSEWRDETADPTPLDHLYISSMPYFILVGLSSDRVAGFLEYPETYAMILAAHDLRDAKRTDFLVQRPDITGNLGFYPAGTVVNQGYGRLPNFLPIETVSNIFPLADYLGPDPRNGMLVLVVDPIIPGKDELMAIEVGTNGVIQARRGVLDTVPREWFPGAEVWLIDSGTPISDGAQRIVGEAPNYKFLTSTTRRQLLPEEAPIDSVVLDDRPYLPFRPANLRVNDVPYGPISIRPDDIVVTWSRRNRLTETGIVLQWTDGDTTPEDGQTTTFQVLYAGTVIQEQTGLTTTSVSIDLVPIVTMYDATELVIRLFSVRDDGPDGIFVSRAVSDYVIQLIRGTGGYGVNYGNSYGTSL